MTDLFYRAFEDKHRGARELIKDRQRVFLQFASPLATVMPGAKTLDLGCGRGEWLELMTESGFDAIGVDLNDGMLASCRDRGLQVVEGDALGLLSSAHDESHAIISAFHFVEHINFDELRSLVAQAFRALKPGGILIMETPNPENIIVATRNFYLDPTHHRPIPPELLTFVPEYSGFARVKTIRLNEPEGLAGNAEVSLHDILGGVSPDYAVVAQKGGHPDAEAALLPAFGKEYGNSLEELVSRWEQKISAQFSRIEAQQRGLEKLHTEELRVQETHLEELRVQERRLAEAQALRLQELRLQELRVQELRVQELRMQELRLTETQQRRLTEAEHTAEHWRSQAEARERRIHEILTSTSWRLTMPVRVLKRLATGDFTDVRTARERTLTLARHDGKRAVVAANSYLSSRPRLRTWVLSWLGRFPSFRARLHRIVANNLEQAATDGTAASFDVKNLSRRSRQVLQDLRDEIIHEHSAHAHRH